MPAPHDHPLKSLADEMARQLSAGGGESAVLLMERFGLLNLPDRKPAGGRPGWVGIWEAGAQGYERSAAMRDEWRYWADVPAIPRGLPGGRNDVPAPRRATALSPWSDSA